MIRAMLAVSGLAVSGLVVAGLAVAGPLTPPAWARAQPAGVTAPALTRPPGHRSALTGPPGHGSALTGPPGHRSALTGPPGHRSALAAQPGPGFSVTAVTASRSSAGRPLLRIRLRENGLGAVRVAGRAQLTSGPGGTQTRLVAARRPVTLAPGRDATMTFLLGAGLPAGPWQARVWVMSGQGAAMARASIQFPSSAGGPALLRRYLKPLAVWLATITLALSVIAWVTVARVRESRRPHEAAA